MTVWRSRCESLSRAPVAIASVDAHPAARGVYDEPFAEYVARHDHFGRGGNDVMRRLRAISARAARRDEAGVA